MRRTVVGSLALVGAAMILGSLTAWLPIRSHEFVAEGTVLGLDGRPVPRLSVFLDPGDNVVMRFETDSAGVFRLPLRSQEPHRATWLICVPGAIPFVGKPMRAELSSGGLTLRRGQYSSSRLRRSGWEFYRATGWTGPIPRQCPRAVNEFVGWRYPKSSGKQYYDGTRTEPDWNRFPGEPVLPPKY